MAKFKDSSTSSASYSNKQQQQQQQQQTPPSPNEKLPLTIYKFNMEHLSTQSSVKMSDKFNMLVENSNRLIQRKISPYLFGDRAPTNDIYQRVISANVSFSQNSFVS